MNHPHSPLMGMLVRLNPLLTVAGPPVEIRRPWRERLFSLPWCPWQASRTETPQIPDPKPMLIGNLIFMHPDTWANLKRELDEHGAVPLSPRKDRP
jgi:hypothetical protein